MNIRREHDAPHSGAAAAMIRAARLIPPLAFGALCLHLVGEQLEGVGAGDVFEALTTFTGRDLALAVVFCCLSHLALALYDVPSARLIGRSAPWPRMMKGGFVGSVMAQSIGMGAITGGYARWRAYRANGFSPAEVAALAALVSLGFAIGAAALAGALILFEPETATAFGASAGTGRAVAGAVLLAIAVLTLLFAGARRPWRLGALTVSPPGWRWLCASVLLAAADLIPAGLCLAVFLPAEATADLAAFLTVYIVATALGHLIGTPGGVGPFEAILFAALPAAPAADLAAAILAYRTVYYLAPLAAASLILIFAGRSPVAPLASGAELRDRVDWIADLAGRPEAGLAELGDKRIHAPLGIEAFAMYGVSGRVWLLMGAPVGPRGEWAALLNGLEAEAKAAGATLAVYKCHDEDAEIWRRRGYLLAPLGVEGLLDAQSFALDGAARRELRRKTRAAAKAGLTIRRHEPGEAPLGLLRSVAGAWSVNKAGPELRFSMGCWNAGYLHRRRIVSGWLDDRPVAFISLLADGENAEWMLDLMRQNGDAPGGAVHALTVDAVEWARDSGAARFNLCMAPLSGIGEPGGTGGPLAVAVAWVYRAFGARFGLHGMRRFKESFRPDWTPRHLAVRSMVDLPEALWAARRLVTGAAQAGGRDDARSPRLAAPPEPGRTAWPDEPAVAIRPDEAA